MEFKDYYGILGIPRSASEKEIKLAYRKLARQYHPDLHPNDKSAEARFREINEAYEALSDPEKRKKYDQFGQYWQGAKGAGGGGMPDLDSLFANLGGVGSFFGRRGAGGTRRGRSARGAAFSDFFEVLFGAGANEVRWPWDAPGEAAPRQSDSEELLPITLEEAARGARKVLELTVEERCGNCGGRGLAGGGICAPCGGSGVMSHKKRIEVKIPKGVTTGSRIRIPGQLDGGRDLYLRIELAPHRMFTVRARDLDCTLPISLWEAVLGGAVEVPTLTGRLMLTIPPETDPGRIFRLAGQGLPGLGSEPPGDLYVTVQVSLPKNLSPRERELFRELAAFRKESLR